METANSRARFLELEFGQSLDFLSVRPEIKTPLAIVRFEAPLSAVPTPSDEPPAGSSGDGSKRGALQEGGDDAAWFYRTCSAHANILPVKDIIEGILNALVLNDEGAMQACLFELLGADAFDVMASVLERRKSLYRLSVTDVMACGHGQTLHYAGQQQQSSRTPLVSSMFTVRSQGDIDSAKRARKDLRRAQRRAHAASAGDDTPRGQDWLSTLGFDDMYLEQERMLGLQGGQAPDDVRGAEGLLRGVGRAGFHQEQKTLPAGTTRTWHEGYEQVHIPPPRRLPKATPSELVEVNVLPEWARAAFAGTKRFNRIQSAIFSVAFHTAENMLICAPTGAGKTNCAMLTLLHLISQHVDDAGVLEGSTLKAVYIAPMKALAQEVVQTFGRRLAPLGLVVRELTGDMQLTRAEVDSAHLIVTTPEKWDVITRKGGTDGSLATKCKLIIIDEVHLLADDRGAVIESVVARTQRLVESAQTTVRIVALSATLPNYGDVALFLRVNPERGLFHFGGEYRPVPLEQTFLGISEKNRMRRAAKENERAFDIALQALRQGHQVMIFVHARKDTVRTAQAVRDLAIKSGVVDEFFCGGPGSPTKDAFDKHDKLMVKSRNAELRELFAHGFTIHHAGMLRPDRGLVEHAFADGAAKILVCTATLAWGVNLPAHTVVIKGTEVYDPQKGKHADLSMLDVMQIFGRAGRPQFDSSGDATLITSHESLPRYLHLLGHQAPIESNFLAQLPDHLNAEVASGTVTNINEAVAWLSYTYLYIRMMKNPLSYGLKYDERDMDPELRVARFDRATAAAKLLDENRMLRFDPRSGNLAVTDLGRTASHFYIQHSSINTFNRMITPYMSDSGALDVLCQAAEFENVKVRPDELSEVDKLRRHCPLEVRCPLEEAPGKVNVLLQAYISQVRPTGFTLISDTNYAAQNGARVSRALFEIALRKGFCSLATIFLRIARSIDRRMWWWETPMRQLADTLKLPDSVIRNLERHDPTLEVLLDMSAREVGSLVHHERLGDKVLNGARSLPRLKIEPKLQPVTRQILRVTIQVTPIFDWRKHERVEPFWIWVGDSENETIYHSEYLLLHKKERHETQILAFTIPIFEPLPPQYFIHVLSDRWVGLDEVHAVSFQHLILPNQHPPHTDLLDLTPLPVSALKNPLFEQLYTGRISHFNPVQTQVFHTLYHTNRNVLLGAPTSSGKTLVAELAILCMLNARSRDGSSSLSSSSSSSKAVYVAPLKALARERLKDWRRKFGSALGLSVLELTGDVTPDTGALRRADIIVTTPEKWDGVTRSWQKRDYVRAVRLVIIDEIHLLGEDRGPVLEVIVSRMRYISARTDQLCRLVGLSTALANAHDLADWLGIDPRPGRGMFNFRPSVRPVPMEVHIRGFPGQHYCPRMATMNKPTYTAIIEHSPKNPVLVFVASRRQTRLTALDLISYCAAADEPKQFLHTAEDEMEGVALTIRDQALRHTLLYGIGIHHAGLNDHDRSTVEELFVAGRIQVLVCTSTLAWGVNFPARLVVIKGTEFFDGKQGRYVDFPVTDVLQMMGRAGRPQFDDKGVSCVFVHAPKKNFYKKFLYEPFPVESSLRDVLHNHMNAEVAGGTIKNKQDAVEYLTWTYFFRRLLVNPTYYHLEDASTEGVQKYLLNLVDTTLDDLEEAGCVDISDDFEVSPSTAGFVASYYYIDYRSVLVVREQLLDAANELSLPSIVQVLANTHEFAELPVRHNEEELNYELSQALPWPVDMGALGSPHTKACLLLQAHFTRTSLPISDYVNDTKSVLDQALRVLNAMADMAADEGLLQTTLNIMRVAQMIVSATIPGESELMQLPGIDKQAASALERQGVGSLAALRGARSLPQLPRKAGDALERLPIVRMRVLNQKDKAVTADADEVLSVELQYERKKHGKLITPHFAKPKECGFWLVLGEGAELLALKRIVLSSSGTQKVELAFVTPLRTAELTLHLVADSVRGLDQRIPIRIAVEG